MARGVGVGGIVVVLLSILMLGVFGVAAIATGAETDSPLFLVMGVLFLFAAAAVGDLAWG